jgi:hypothetical protein
MSRCQTVLSLQTLAGRPPHYQFLAQLLFRVHQFRAQMRGAQSQVACIQVEEPFTLTNGRAFTHAYALDDAVGLRLNLAHVSLWDDRPASLHDHVNDAESRPDERGHGKQTGEVQEAAMLPPLRIRSACE